MFARKSVLGVAAVAALAIPFAASAQQYWGQPDDGQPHGDYDNRGWGWRFPGYPEFRGAEMHIRREIQDAVRDDMIEPDDARDLFGRLRQIQWREQREFQVHGWRLPDDDRQRIHFELDQLDRLVDQIRQEP